MKLLKPLQVGNEPSYSFILFSLNYYFRIHEYDDKKIFPFTSRKYLVFIGNASIEQETSNDQHNFLLVLPIFFSSLNHLTIRVNNIPFIKYDAFGLFR